jgi:hypothetical protein
MNQKPAPAAPAGHGMSHGFVIALIVCAAIIAGVVVWWVFLKAGTPVIPSQVPVSPRPSSGQSILPPSDSTASISQSLDSIATDTLDAELEQINKDLNSL